MTYNTLQYKNSQLTNYLTCLLIITWSTLPNDTLVTFYELYEIYFLIKLQVNLETVLVEKSKILSFD